MTIGGLIKKLQKIEKVLGPRRKVVIELAEFRLVDDEYSHWEPHGCDQAFIPWGLPGESRELASGAERMRMVAVIR